MNAIRRPVVGIIARTFALPDRFARVVGTLSPYTDCVFDAGGLPLIIPPKSVERLRILDGLVLAGGEDLGDSVWWSSGSPRGQIDVARDDAEQTAIHFARKANIPTLGICRGAQIISCVLGGQIARFESSAAGAHQGVDGRQGREHNVSVVQNTTLSSLFHESPSIRVTSRHECFISRLGRNLRPAAYADDGTIEAFDSPKWRCLGLQWHPEWLQSGSQPDLRPFEWLVDHAHGRGEE